LRGQTLRDFEWLVVDDGSTDGTSELIKSWVESAGFPIRYFWQDNSGKHIAHNLAIKEARGSFFIPLDSDDAMASDALEQLLLHWNAIPVSDRAHFAGVFGLCYDQHGQLIGSLYPESPLDTDLRELLYVRRVRGEKWGMFRTDVLRQFPFPEVRNTYIPEGVIWLEIAKTYKTRFVNGIPRIYFVNDEETGMTISIMGARGQQAKGRLYYYVWLLNNDLHYFFHSPAPFLKAALMIPIAAWRSGQTVASALKQLQKFSAKALVCLALPFALMARFHKSIIN